MGKFNFEATVESPVLGYRKRQALGISPSMPAQPLGRALLIQNDETGSKWG